MSSNYPDNIQKSNKTFFYDFFSNPNNPEELFSLLYLLHKSEKDEIYKAKYNETKEIFCIKKISLDNIFIDKNTSKNFYYQMKEETSLMKSLTNNENIIQYYGSFFSFETKNIFLIFEYLKARSVLDLGKILDRNYTEEEIAIIINDILNGLIYIHQLNIANRNIKINNILITEDGRTKIGNFEKDLYTSQRTDVREPGLCRICGDPAPDTGVPFCAARDPEKKYQTRFPALRKRTDPESEQKGAASDIRPEVYD